MTSRTITSFAAVLLSLATVASTQARQPAASPSNPQSAAHSPDTLFDRAVTFLASDPIAAKPQFAKAATAYEQLLADPLSQSDRARILYNAGASHQLAGDLGLAVLDLRRAELLSPITSGLRERLEAAQAAARTDSTQTSPTPSHDPTFVELLRDSTLSLPHTVCWRIAAITYIAFWVLLLLRVVTPYHCGWHPHASLLVISAIAFLAPASALFEFHQRDTRAARELIVLADTIGRSEPDDLTGAPSAAAPFKPGAALLALEQRTGGNGQTWIRVRPSDAPASDEDTPIWIPAASAAPVLDR